MMKTWLLWRNTIRVRTVGYGYGDSVVSAVQRTLRTLQASLVNVTAPHSRSPQPGLAAGVVTKRLSALSFNGRLDNGKELFSNSSAAAPHRGTARRATPGGELTTIVVSKVGGNDVNVTHCYDANKAPVVQSLNSINGLAVDIATSDAFVLQVNALQNTNTSTQEPVTLTQALSQTILPTLNVNVNNVDTAASTTVGTNGTVETVTLVDGSHVNLTSGNQYVSTTTAPPADSAIAIELPVVPTTSPTTTTPSNITINGVIVTDNGDGTYAYSLPTATGGVETVAGNSNGAAVVNVYTAGGAFTGSETTGFSANAHRRYKVRSCLRTYLLGYRHKKYLETGKNCFKRTARRYLYGVSQPNT